MTENELHSIKNALLCIQQLDIDLSTIEKENKSFELITCGTWGQMTQKNCILNKRDLHIQKLREVFDKYNVGIRSTTYPKETIQTTSRFLAFIDILGFSKIVENNSSEELADLIEYSTGSLIRTIQLPLSSAKPRTYPNGTFSSDLSFANVNSLLLSDTILLWSADDSFNSFKSIVEVVFGLFEWQGKWPLRGVVTFGPIQFTPYDIAHSELHISQSIVYGKAIVEAHKLEKIQEWMGCIVTKTAIEAARKKYPEEYNELRNKYFLEYDVPFKDHVFRKEYALKWGYRKTEDTIKRYFTELAHQTTVPEEALHKYKNTLDFIKFINQE